MIKILSSHKRAEPYFWSVPIERLCWNSCSRCLEQLHNACDTEPPKESSSTKFSWNKTNIFVYSSFYGVIKKYKKRNTQTSQFKDSVTSQDHSVFHQKCCICCHIGATKDFTKQAITHLMINKTKTPSRQIYGNHHSQASVIKSTKLTRAAERDLLLSAAPPRAGWVISRPGSLQQGWAGPESSHRLLPFASIQHSSTNCQRKCLSWGKHHSRC